MKSSLYEKVSFMWEIGKKQNYRYMVVSEELVSGEGEEKAVSFAFYPDEKETLNKKSEEEQNLRYSVSKSKKDKTTSMTVYDLQKNKDAEIKKHLK